MTKEIMVEAILEVDERTLETVTQRGIDLALEKIKNNFENPANPDDKLEYHNVIHSENVIRRTEQILRTIKSVDPSLVTEHDIQLGKFAAASHDVVQEWEKNPLEENGYKIVKRKRFTLSNEEKSSDFAIGYMERANRENPGVYSDKDMKVVREAHIVTVPSFSLEYGTVSQPNLKRSSPIIAIAVALADLGGGGMEGGNVAKSEGNAVFREDNLDILVKFEGELSAGDKKHLTRRMIVWTVSQVKFFKGRKKLHDTELSYLPENTRIAVSALFGKFDDSIQSLTLLSEDRKKMTYQRLVNDFGY